MRLPGTKLIEARALPTRFAIPTTYHEGGLARAVRVGRRVRIHFLGHSVLVRATARVRVVIASLGTAEMLGTTP